MNYTTREEWLNAAIDELRPGFAAEGFPLSDRIRVACGFPANHSRNGRVGECHASTASADQHYEILISPVLADLWDVFAVLVHELCHTLPGCMNHGKNFAAAAFAMGLEAPNGKWKMTVPGAGFTARYQNILQGLDAYPHAELRVGTTKKQTTRLLKATCPCCGYTIRLTKTWADKGLPICSLDGATLQLA